MSLRRPGLPLLILSGVLWGTGGFFGSLLHRVSGLHFLAVAAYRIGVGGLIILAVLIGSRRRWWPRDGAAWRRILLVAAMTASYQACYFLAVSLTSLSIATLITIGASPVIVTMIGALAGRQPVRGRTGLVLTLAVGGLALLIGAPPAGIGGERLLLGALLSLGSATGFAVITIAGSRPVEGLDEATQTGMAFVVGGAAVAAFAGPLVGLGFSPTPPSMLLVLLLGLLPTAVAYISYFRGLRTESATLGALMAMLEPLTGVLLAVLFLGDTLTVPGLVGAVLLMTALALSAKPSGETTHPEVPSLQ